MFGGEKEEEKAREMVAAEGERGQGEEGVDHVEVATRSPQAPVKGPTAIRIRGAPSDRDEPNPASTSGNETDKQPCRGTVSRFLRSRSS